MSVVKWNELKAELKKKLVFNEVPRNKDAAVLVDEELDAVYPVIRIDGMIGFTVLHGDGTREYIDYGDLTNPEAENWMSTKNVWGNSSLEEMLAKDEEEDRQA